MSVKQKRGHLKVADVHAEAPSSSTVRAEIELLREKTTLLVNKSPEKAALLLSHWINAAQSSKTRQNKKVA